MVSIFNRSLPLCALVIMGCNLGDKDKEVWSPPGFIFRCVDDRGCGYGDDDVMWGYGEGFGPVIVGREFSVYYGSVRLSEDDGGDDYYDSIREDEGVYVLSASSELITGNPLHAVRPGECAVIAMNDQEKVVDYTFITARYGGDDDDNTTHRDAGVDGGEVGDDLETERDTGTLREDSDSGLDTESVEETDSDSAFPFDSDTWGEVWDGGDGGIILDTDSETVLDTDTDEPISTNDAGIDSGLEMDAGVRVVDAGVRTVDAGVRTVDGTDGEGRVTR